jgi:hypothetical protein
MNAHLSNPDILAVALFYAVTNGLYLGRSARINDAIHMATNFGIDTVTQDKIGLTKELEKLNWPKK